MGTVPPAGSCPAGLLASPELPVQGLLAGDSLGEGQLAQLHEAPNWGIWPVSSSCPRGVDPDLLFPSIHQQLRWFTFRLVLGSRLDGIWNALSLVNKCQGLT